MIRNFIPKIKSAMKCPNPLLMYHSAFLSKHTSKRLSVLKGLKNYLTLQQLFIQYREYIFIYREVYISYLRWFHSHKPSRKGGIEGFSPFYLFCFYYLFLISFLPSSYYITLLIPLVVQQTPYFLTL